MTFNAVFPPQAYAVVSTVSPAWLGQVVGNQDRDALRPVLLTFSCTEAEAKAKELRREVFVALAKDSAAHEPEQYVQRLLAYRDTIKVVTVNVTDPRRE